MASTLGRPGTPCSMFHLNAMTFGSAIAVAVAVAVAVNLELMVAV